MSPRVSFTVVGEPRAALLSRLLGFFSQHDLGAPDLTVTRDGEEMIVRLVSPDIGAHLAPIVSGKMASLVGVRSVDLAVPQEPPNRAADLALQAFPAHR
ncbi:hypothetical protein [Aurantiacibacter hainanensis]|uniref:hypothetical protein n=1 Tax=Aurantiacibacter hainanensis TaxID=3076114 RepID=UPI0030C6EABB